MAFWQGVRKLGPELLESDVGYSSDHVTLTLLPDQRPRLKEFGTSLLAHVAVLSFVLVLPVAHYQQQALKPRTITYVVTPLVDRYKPPRHVPPPPQPKLVQPRVTPELAELRVPREVLRRERPPEAPKLQPAKFDPKVLAATPNIPRPPRIVKTGLLPGASTGSSAPATLKAPMHKVQTGGFGDPNGVNGEGSPNARLTIARLGSPDLPSGPGFGNGAGGARGLRGTVKSAGFGNGIATNAPGPGNGGGGPVRTGGFSDARPAEAASRPRQIEGTPQFVPVEVLFKPTPAYTDQARRMKLEGEVLLEVVFAAAGDLRVLRVARGLGYGLDEEAVRAARQIRFKPARRNGQPTDTVALVHITFQLAY